MTIAANPIRLAEAGNADVSTPTTVVVPSTRINTTVVAMPIITIVARTLSLGLVTSTLIVDVANRAVTGIRRWNSEHLKCGRGCHAKCYPREARKHSASTDEARNSLS